ncbi:MAG TPA: DUF2219 domain-containing protein [Citreicella sp.]|jgi:hypothetical protein|nr:DUF2219 domain-containing protein [Citreicella sp.]
MFRSILLAALAVISLSSAARAEDRVRLGYGRLLTNDSFGDVHDRWQTGSVASSRIWGRGWSGRAPERPFELLELRLGVQVMAPGDLRQPDPKDRPFAGALSLGLHTHFSRGDLDWTLGGDLVVTGPQTRLGDLQTAMHDSVGAVTVPPSVLDDQVKDGLHPTLVAEAGRELDFGRARLRPFAEARLGAESLLRAGVDLTLGRVGQGELLVRDPVTGQRYRVITDPVPGMALVFGADIAHVAESAFLPESSGADLRATRERLRAGLHWQGDRMALFYGLTWLGREFDAQPEGQLVGSLRLQVSF